MPCRVKSRTKSRGLESDVNAINRGRDKFVDIDIEGDGQLQTNGTTGIWQPGVLTGVNSMIEREW